MKSTAGLRVVLGMTYLYYKLSSQVRQFGQALRHLFRTCSAPRSGGPAVLHRATAALAEPLADEALEITAVTKSHGRRRPAVAMNDALIESDAAFLAAQKIYVAPEDMV